MADVSDPSELFVLELHEDENTRDSDDDKIELDDVSTPPHQTMEHIHHPFIYIPLWFCPLSFLHISTF